MKKIFLGIVLSFGIIAQSYSQDTLRFANSGFEEWTTEPGYDVNVDLGFFTLPVNFYGEYVHPNSWDRPYYHMNKNATISGAKVTVNTDVPMHNFKKETKSVTEGKAAACLSSFQLNDVISSIAIQQGRSSLANYGLTEDMVCASIISTGVLTKNGNGTYIKQIIGFGLLGCGGTKNEAELYDSLKNYDMNKYVQGGLALNGFYPTRLHGSYKYVSNSTTDAGEVIIIGTHYDSDAKKRLMVGGGYKNDLNTAKTAYEDFDVYYRPFTNVEPDSLIIICMSSGLTNCADESKLYLDNFFLLSDCFDVENLVASNVTTNSAVITWDENRHISWEYVFGKKGFNIDEVEPVSCDDAVVELSDLEKNTEYEMYVRTICSATNMSDWAKVEFSTLDWPTCENVTELAVSEISQLEAIVSWTSPEEGNTFEIYYGEEGVSIDDAELLQVETSPFTLGNLSIVTNYDVYVRAVRENAYASEWTKASFTTLDWPTCENVTEIVVSEVTQSGAIVSWGESENNYEIAFGESGFSLDDAEIESVTESGYVLSNLKLHTSYEMYVRAVKENAYASEWTKIEFTTLDMPTCETVSEVSISDVTTNGAVVSWTSIEEGNTFEIYFGEEGVSIDDAEFLKIETSPYVLANLSANTSYDVYVRAVREGAYNGEWQKVSFATEKITCAPVSNVEITAITDTSAIISVPLSEYTYQLVFAPSDEAYDLSQPIVLSDVSYQLNHLSEETSYVVYVRAVKEGYADGEWTKYEFTTKKTELVIVQLNPVEGLNVIHEDSTYYVVWNDSQYEYEISYGLSGFDIDTAVSYHITGNNYQIPELENGTYDVYVRAVSDENTPSEWQKVSFEYEKKEVVIEPECKFESVVQDFFAGYLVSGYGLCGMVDLTWENPETNPQYEWFDVAIYEFAEGMDNTVDEEDIQRITNPYFNVSYTEYANEAKELVLYVRVGAEGCESSDWAKYQFTAPTIDVAIDEVENGNGNVSVYPTLSDGTFFISFNSQASADVTVYDVNGSIVTKMNDVANNTPIQLSQKGLYKIEVELDGKKTVKSVVIY